MGKYLHDHPQDLSPEVADTSQYRNFQPLAGGCQLPNELPGIDLENALARLDGNRELFAKLLTDFNEKYKNTGQSLHTLMAKYRLEQYDDELHAEILMLVHTIKGIFGNLGAVELCSVSRNLEKAFKNNSSVPKEQLVDIEFLLKKFFQALASVWAAAQMLHKPAKTLKHIIP